MVPGDERKSYEELKTYHSMYPPEVDIGWSDAFQGASAWLADRERKRIEREKEQQPNNSPNNSGNYAMRF